jgi:hypothetical protein
MLQEASHWLVTSWKAAVTFAGGLVLILGLIFHPPWAGGSSSKSDTTTRASETCPGVVDGRIKELTIDPQPIPLRAYWLLHPDARPTHPSKERGRTLGRVVRFRFQASNYPRKELGIWWWIVNTRGMPVSDPTLQRQLAFAVTPGSCKTTTVKRDFFATLPKGTGEYRVQIELDAGDEQLDLARTKIFSVVS